MMTSQTNALKLCALLAFAVLANGCKNADAIPTPEVAVQAEPAERKPLTQFVTADTVLSPQAQAAIVPKISAPIKTFLVQRGAHVRQGQLLAVLENADLNAALHDSRGAVMQADAAYLTTTKAAVVEDLQKAQLDLAQANANLEVAQTVFDSRQSLLQQGAIPRRDADTARAALVQAKAARDVAAQHLASLNAVSQAATIKNAEGARDSAQGKLEAAQAGLSYSEIRSPIDGVVTDRPLFQGEMASTGQPIITVMDLSTLIAKVHLSEQQTHSLKLGSPANVSVAGQDTPVKGRVRLISPALDTGSTTLEVWIAVPNKDGKLKAGASAHVAISSETVPDALSIPNEALITTKAGQTAVMAIAPDNVAHQKIVTTGISDGQGTQILSGLAAGDMVVTRGAYGMDDATKVKIAAANEGEQDKPGSAKAKGGDQ